MQVVIRRATLDDAAKLSELAARIFYDTFAEFNTPADMASFLSGAYTESRQRREIGDPLLTTLLVECDGTLAGYAQLQADQAGPGVTGPDPLEIMRFYLEKSFHGRGVAHRLMGEIETIARAAGAKTLWLGVWERNDRALAFYRKFGFQQVGKKPFAVGEDLQTDLVLERPLP